MTDQNQGRADALTPCVHADDPKSCYRVRCQLGGKCIDDDMSPRQPAAAAVACPQCGGSLTTWKCTCDPIWEDYNTPIDPQDVLQDTGNPEADRLIGRLTSADPDFNDCTDAAVFIRRIVAEHRGPDGFVTWKEAAIAERQKRVEIENRAPSPADERAALIANALDLARDTLIANCVDVPRVFEKIAEARAASASEMAVEPAKIDEYDLSTSDGGRGYIAEFFAKRLRRHDFGRYIHERLAADFACALAQYLRDRDAAPPPAQADARVGLTAQGSTIIDALKQAGLFLKDYEPETIRSVIQDLLKRAAHPGQPEPRAEVTHGDTTMDECMASLLDRLEAAELYADRYRYLRERPLDAVSTGGVFAGKTPDNVVLNGADLDAAVDAARTGASS